MPLLLPHSPEGPPISVFSLFVRGSGFLFEAKQHRPEWARTPCRIRGSVGPASRPKRSREAEGRMPAGSVTPSANIVAQGSTAGFFVCFGGFFFRDFVFVFFIFLGLFLFVTGNSTSTFRNPSTVRELLGSSAPVAGGLDEEDRRYVQGPIVVQERGTKEEKRPRQAPGTRGFLEFLVQRVIHGGETDTCLCTNEF